jgi:hypothetical protein
VFVKTIEEVKDRILVCAKISRGNNKTEITEIIKEWINFIDF